MIYLSKVGAGADSDHTWIRPCPFPRQVRGSWLHIGKLAQRIDMINVIVVDLKEILLLKVMTGYVKEYAFKSDIAKLFPTKYALGICKCFELV